jgi:hypothetical protein
MDNAGEWSEERVCWTMGETETHFVDLCPQLMGLTFIALTPKTCPLVYDERWDYPNFIRALAAAVAWGAVDFGGEPTGWTRHMPTGRRRKDGDPSTEEIRH